MTRDEEEEDTGWPAGIDAKTFVNAVALHNTRVELLPKRSYAFIKHQTMGASAAIHPMFTVNLGRLKKLLDRSEAAEQQLKQRFLAAYFHALIQR